MDTEEVKLGGKTPNEAENVKRNWTMVWQTARKEGLGMKKGIVKKKRVSKKKKDEEDAKTGLALKEWVLPRESSQEPEMMVQETIAERKKKLGLKSKKELEMSEEVEKKKMKFEKLLSNFRKKPKCDNMRMKKLEPSLQTLSGLGNKEFGLVKNEDFDRIWTEETVTGAWDGGREKTGLAGVKKGLVAERKELFGGRISDFGSGEGKRNLELGKKIIWPAKNQPNRVKVIKEHESEEIGIARKENPWGVLGARKNRGGLKDQLEGLRRQCDQ